MEASAVGGRVAAPAVEVQAAVAGAETLVAGVVVGVLAAVVGAGVRGRAEAGVLGQGAPEAAGDRVLVRVRCRWCSRDSVVGYLLCAVP